MDTRTLSQCLLPYCLIIVGIVSSVYLEAPPSFRREPESTVARQHGKVVLRCRADPDTTHIGWKSNGDMVVPNKQAGITIKPGKLILRSFRNSEHFSDHGGIYQCVANNSVGTIISKEAILARAVIGEFRQFPSENRTVTQGNTAVIPCEHPASIPPAKLMFKVNNTLITQSRGRYHIMPSGNLQIANVRPSDQGVYQCIGRNTVNEQRKIAPHRTTLKVVAPMVRSQPRLTFTPPSKLEAKKGTNVTIECVAEASPLPTISWNKYQGQLPEGRYEFYLGNLILFNVQERDIGSYVCRADNGNGRTTAQAITVIKSILEPPTIKVAPMSQTVEVGATMTLPCLTRGRPTVRVTWLHNGIPVIKGGNIKISGTTLAVSNIQLQHGGMYQCFARSDLGQAHAEAHVQIRSSGVIPRPTTDPTENDRSRSTEAVMPTITQGPSNTSAKHGETVTLQCLTEGATSIKWLRDDKLLHLTSERASPTNRPPGNRNSRRRPAWEELGLRSSNNVASSNRNSPSNEISENKLTLLGSGALLVRNVTSEDEGLFTCVATNNRGFVKESAHLTVTGSFIRPSRPISGGKAKLQPPHKPSVTVLSDTSVQLDWVVPGRPGLRIVFFKVQYRMFRNNERFGDWKTVEENILPSRRSYILRGLQTGVTYRFRILAVFSNKDNRNSANSRRVQLGQQEEQTMINNPAPNIQQLQALAPASLKVTWQYPRTSSVQGFIVAYRKQHSAMSGGRFRNVRLEGSDRETYILTDLEGSTNYKVKVAAILAKGHGPWSVGLVQETFALGGSSLLTTPAVVLPDTESASPGRDSDVRSGSPTGSHASNHLLYMILGIVLGVMMVLLIVFVCMCWCKQRQQRRHIRKTKDASRMIHTDSLRKQYLNTNGTYPINGLSYLNERHTNSLKNGFLPNINSSNTSSVNHMNITPNPHDVEMESLDNSNPGLYSQRAGSIDDILPPPPPLHTFGKKNKTDTGSRSENLPCRREPSNLSFETTGSIQCPPNYSSLSRDHSDDSPDRSPINIPGKLPSNFSYGSIHSQNRNRSADPKKSSMDHIPRAYELKTKRSTSGTPSESSSCSSRRNQRRRRSPTEHVLEQGTNTEPSSECTQNSLGTPSTPDSILEEEQVYDKDQCSPTYNNPDDIPPEHCEIPPSPDLPLHDISRYKIQSPNLYEDIEQFDEEDDEDYNTSPLMLNRINQEYYSPVETNGESPILNRHNSRTDKPRLMNNLDNIHQTSPLINKNNHKINATNGLNSNPNTWNYNDGGQLIGYQPVYSNLLQPNEYSDSDA